MIPYGLPEKQTQSLIETATPNQVGQVVCNADGTPIGGGGGAQDVVNTIDPANADSIYYSTALEDQNVVSAAPAILLWVNGRIDESASTDTYFLQIYDSATVPADGAVTLLSCTKVQHTSNFDSNIIFLFDRGLPATAGISFALSSTEFTKTEMLGSNFLSLTIGYKEV